MADQQKTMTREQAIEAGKKEHSYARDTERAVDAGRKGSQREREVEAERKGDATTSRKS